MNGINRIFIMGHLGTDPNTFESTGGHRYTSLNIATHRNRKDDRGEWQQHTDWHRVSVWGRQGETCADRLEKGQPVMVEGYLAQYEQNNDQGVKQWRTAINAIKVEFLPRSGIKSEPQGSALS